MSTEPMSDPTAPPPEIALTTGDAEHRVIRATSPVKVLNLVPYLLGFHPDRSLVIIGTEPPRATIRVTVRCPLPDSADPKLVTLHMEHMVKLLNGNDFPQAIVSGYGPDELVTPFIDEFRSLAGNHGIELLELLRVEGGRYWWYTCTDPACCPPEGTPFELTADPKLASLLAEGMPDVLQSHENLAALVSSVTGADAAAMRRATRRAEARVARLLEQAPTSADEPSGHALLVHEGIKAMTAAIQQYQGGGDISRSEAAWLTVSLRDIQLRDDAWSRLEVAHRKANLRLMLDLTRLARRGYIAPPATLLAFVAWQPSLAMVRSRTWPWIERWVTIATTRWLRRSGGPSTSAHRPHWRGCR